MNLQFYFEKLLNSEEFKKFKTDNPDAYFCGGFFIVDKVGKDNKQHLDFYVGGGEKGQVWSFQLEDGIQLVPVEQHDDRTLEKVDDNIDFNFEYIEKLIMGEMFEHKIKNEIQKIILSLQNFNGKPLLIGTVFISRMGLLKIKIDLSDMTVIDFEKKSFMDMMRKGS